MAVSLVFMAAFFLFTLVDAILSIRTWKKAKDGNLPNPYQVVTSSAFKSQKMNLINQLD